jgi:hypothetical protein
VRGSYDPWWRYGAERFGGLEFQESILFCVFVHTCMYDSVLLLSAMLPSIGPKGAFEAYEHTQAFTHRFRCLVYEPLCAVDHPHWPHSYCGGSFSGTSSAFPAWV